MVFRVVAHLSVDLEGAECVPSSSRPPDPSARPSTCGFMADHESQLKLERIVDTELGGDGALLIVMRNGPDGIPDLWPKIGKGARGS